MILGLDIEPIIDLIEADIWLFQVWVWTLFGMLAFAIVMEIAHRHRNSPVERILHKRQGFSR